MRLTFHRVAMLVPVLVFAQAARSGTLSAKDVAAIRRTDAAYVDAWRSNDRDAVLAVFARNAVIVPQGHAPIAGLQRVAEFWWPAGGGKTTVTSFANDILEVGGSGDFAFSRGMYSFTFDYEVDGHPQKRVNRGTYIMLFHKDDRDVWKITHRMWSDLRP